MLTRPHSEFIQQQGFEKIAESDSAPGYGALMFQPRIIALFVAMGIVLQSPELFLVLAGILWFNALLPRLNPFDSIYNTLVAAPRKRPRLGPAPVPRRFAQSIAGTLMLFTSIALFRGWRSAAWITEAALVTALLALIFGRFCVGSYIFHSFRKGSRRG